MNETNRLINNFREMLNTPKYITWKEWNQFLEKYQMVFIKEGKENESVKQIANHGYLEIENHNEQWIEEKLKEEKEYFDKMFELVDSSIKLDEEQRKAIINEEDYSLIIAGAGAGKTTTMAAKVKYLIERCHIPPEKIAVISYTNKATEELEDRIKYEFQLPVDIMTFHSLGIKIIRSIFNNSMKPVSEKEQKEIIIKFVKEKLYPNKKQLTEYIETFNKYNENYGKMFSKGFVKNINQFAAFEEYFQDYKERKQKENEKNLENIIKNKVETYLNLPMPMTLKKEIVRSKAEAKIANFLFLNGISYKYEEPYPERVDIEWSNYLPDFTIEVNGVPLYIEYFGLSEYMENGTLSQKNRNKYNRHVRKLTQNQKNVI